MDPRIGLSDRQRSVLDRVNINAPAKMFADGLFDKILKWDIHPEIGLDAGSLDMLSKNEWEDLARRLEEKGLCPSAHGPFMDLAPAARDQKVLELSRERYAKALEAAALFKPKHMVFHTAYDKKYHIDYREQWIEMSLDTWRPLARRAKELGIMMVLENTTEFEPAEMKPLLEALAPEGVGFCFDIGHANSFGRAPILEWLEVLHPHLKAMHLHDNKGDHDRHLPIGEGNIDFKLFFRWLTDHDLKPHVTLEPHKKEHLVPTVSALTELWPWRV